MAKCLLSMSLVCFLIARIQANGCNFNPTHLVKHGHELKECAFWETKTKDVVKCAQSCIRRKKCKSFNFNVNTGLCQLYGNTGTPSKADNKLVYSEIGDWPSHVDPHCYNNSCSEDEICIPGNRIGAQICTHSWSKHEWIRFQEKCYFIYGPPKTYADAKKFCQSMDSELVQVETQEENEFLKAQLRLANEAQGSSFCAGTTKCRIWNALYEYTVNGHETWTSNGQELTYTDWGHGEPNDHNGLELCTVFDRSINFRWNDVSCGDLYLPLCEK